MYYARALVPLGLRVILAEYPGYGPRSGSLGEASLVADAIETVALAHRQYGGRLLAAALDSACVRFRAPGMIVVTAG